jgi:hypothetical protein
VGTTKPARKVVAALKKKGMEPYPGDHRFLRMKVEGVTQIVTKVSHGTTEITDYHAGLMATQCVLQLKEFWDLVNCPLSADAWLKKITERCVDGHNPYLFRR